MRAVGAEPHPGLGARRRLAACEDGAAILEFALVLPILVALLAGAFEFGRILLIRKAMIDAVGGSARYLGRVPDPSCAIRCSRGAQEALARARDEIVRATRLQAGAVSVTSDWQPRNARVALTAVATLDVEWLRLVGLGRSFRLEVVQQEPWIAD